MSSSYRYPKARVTFPSTSPTAHRSNPRLSRSARAGPAASTHIWPRGAARPSGATPPAHATRRSLSAPTMRCASIWRPSGYAPLGLTIPATSRSQVRLLPSGSRETRPLPLVSHPYTERTRPIAPTLFRRESDAARSLANRCPAPVRAPRTRESVPVVATLTPRRVARRCGSTLSGSNLPGQVKKPSLLSCCGTRAR